MFKALLIFVFLVAGFSSQAQQIDVDYKKDIDYSKFKTFKFGIGEILTPKDKKQIPDKLVNQWITDLVTRELEMKGLVRVDSAADLIVSYAAGTLSRSDMGNVGPMGLAPGSNERTFIHDYEQTSLIIDLNDSRNVLVWRINSTTNMTAQTGEQMIEQIVSKGFKKFAKASKKRK